MVHPYSNHWQIIESVCGTHRRIPRTAVGLSVSRIPARNVLGVRQETRRAPARQIRGTRPASLDPLCHDRKPKMARALWTGAISFGLVNLPVELYSAEDRKSFDSRCSTSGTCRQSVTSDTTRSPGKKWTGQTSSKAMSTKGPIRRAVGRGFPARQCEGDANYRYPDVRAGR